MFQKQEYFHQIIRKKHKQTILSAIREELIKQLEQQQSSSQRQQLMIIACKKLILNQERHLNLYVNIKQILDYTLQGQKQNNFSLKLALFLYIVLTTNTEVMEYIVQNNCKQEWTRLKFLLLKYPYCRQNIYDIMKRIIDLTTAKSQRFIQKSGNFILSKETTLLVIDLNNEEDEDSSYYEFVSTYLQHVPEDHISVLFTSGYAFKSLEYPNHSIYLAILNRIQSPFASQDLKSLHQLILLRKQQLQQMQAL